MKLRFLHNAKKRLAFTLVEAMIACTVMVLVVMSVILCNLWGLAMAARQQIWMTASDDSTQAYAALMQDIHSATSFCIGTGSNATGFTTNTTTAQSDCLLIYPQPTNTSWICYYYNPYSNANIPYNDAFVRTNWTVTSTSTNGARRIITYAYSRGTGGGGITNDTHLFTTENLDGSLMTNNSSTPVMIDLYMGFIKSRNAQIVIAGPTNVADVFQIRTRVCARPQL
jgi:hypothetical protein